MKKITFISALILICLIMSKPVKASGTIYDDTALSTLPNWGTKATSDIQGGLAQALSVTNTDPTTTVYISYVGGQYANVPCQRTLIKGTSKWGVTDTTSLRDYCVVFGEKQGYLFWLKDKNYAPTSTGFSITTYQEKSNKAVITNESSGLQIFQTGGTYNQFLNTINSNINVYLLKKNVSYDTLLSDYKASGITGIIKNCYTAFEVKGFSESVPSCKDSYITYSTPAIGGSVSGFRYSQNPLLFCHAVTTAFRDDLKVEGFVEVSGIMHKAPSSEYMSLNSGKLQFLNTSYSSSILNIEEDLNDTISDWLSGNQAFLEFEKGQPLNFSEQNLPYQINKITVYLRNYIGADCSDWTILEIDVNSLPKNNNGFATQTTQASGTMTQGSGNSDVNNVIPNTTPHVISPPVSTEISVENAEGFINDIKELIDTLFLAFSWLPPAFQSLLYSGFAISIFILIAKLIRG